MSLKVWFKDTFELPFSLTNINSVLLSASKVYYNNTTKLMSDSDFDKLKDFYESKSKSTFPVGAPAVGATLSLDHSYKEFAGTLSKCKNIKEFKTWLKTKKIKPSELLISIKADGHSIIIEFVYCNETKQLVIDKVLTRGADGKGKDLTQIFKDNLTQIPIPSLNFDCAVAYEAIVTYADFEELNKEKKEYKNPRSVINAIFSTKGQSMFKYITLLPIKIKAKNNTDALTRIKEMKVLKTMPNHSLLQLTKSDVNNVERIYEKHENNRLATSSPITFMYDGLVVESSDEEIRSSLGYNSTEPNFATAIKFTPAEQRTVVKSVEWSVEGHSARYTPVVKFEPVEIRGNTYQQVSLANLKRFNSLDLHIGDEIIFTLRNDTLGYVDKLSTSLNSNKKPVKINPPTNCVSCNEVLKTDSVFLFCDNLKCDLNRIGDIYAFIEKSGIKNIGLEMVKKMYGNVIFVPENLLTIDAVAVSKLEGLGKVSANNIVNEIEKVTASMKDYMLLGSLNILNLGRTRAKIVLAEIDFYELIDMVQVNNRKKFISQLVKINGIGEEIANAFYDGIITKMSTLIAFIENINVEIVTTKVVRVVGFKQLSFCHTGSPEPITNRAELKEIIEDAGHKLVGGVTKNTSYLINNDITSTTGKNVKAVELGINIISVADALAIIGK